MDLRIKYDHILIRYGELALKGKNQRFFIKTLVKNLRRQIRNDLSIEAKLERIQGRLMLYLDGNDAEVFFPSLDKTFGIISYSPVLTTTLNVNDIVHAAQLEFSKAYVENKTFRVSVKRANKQFPITSMDFQLLIANSILDKYPQAIPNLKNYDVELSIDIRFEGAYIFARTYHGLGGLPLGTGGRSMFLLSGGIDSPVAGWLTMRRGVVVEAIHFHSYPYTSKEAEEKVLKLADLLAEYADHIVVHLVPFTKLQELIGSFCNDSLRITIMRRLMLRIAEKIATNRHAKAIVNGDNIGQVASQTIESLYAINEVTNLPILRPVLTYDKIEIMSLAKKIGTYETSILPFEDCCTVFVPTEPKTKPRIDECLKEERRIESLEHFIEDAIFNTKSITCYSGNRDRTHHESLFSN